MNNMALKVGKCLNGPGRPANYNGTQEIGSGTIYNKIILFGRDPRHPPRESQKPLNSVYY